MVLVAEVGEHRAPGLARDLVRRGDPATVVGHGGAQALEGTGRAPGEQAVAVADDADLAGLRCVPDGRLDVLHHAGRRQRLRRSLQRHARGHVVGFIAQFHVRLHAMEGRRRDGQVALLGIPVRDRADVCVDAEDLLDHDDATLGLSLGWAT